MSKPSEARAASDGLILTRNQLMKTVTNVHPGGLRRNVVPLSAITNPHKERYIQQRVGPFVC